MTPRPVEHLITAGRLYPGAWKLFDAVRQDRGQDLPDWPEWCYCPLTAAYAIVSGGGANRVPLHQIGDVARLGALAAWRPTQGIYRFDPEMYSALVETDLSGNLPSELLRYLPEWCVYIETPGMEWFGAELYGFFAHLEWDIHNGREELRFLLDSRAMLAKQAIHLGAWTLEDAISNAFKVSDMHAREMGISHRLGSLKPEQSAAQLAPLVSLLLYLCQEQPDYAGADRPVMPQPKRTKNGLRLFPPDKPRTWDVGVRMGAALRAAQEAIEREPDVGLGAGTHASPRPHVRRAHWHTYRVGPGRVDSLVKWLPPIPVNIEYGEDLPAVIHPVRQIGQRPT